MTTECRNFEQAMQFYLDGRLAGEERVALEDHVGGCAACRAWLEAYAVLLEGLENMPLGEPDVDFNRAIFERIPFGARGGVRGKGGRWAVKVGVALAVLLGLVSPLGLYLLIGRSGEILRAAGSGFLGVLGILERLGTSSLNGTVDLARLIHGSPILNSLLHVGRIMLDVVSTTVTDPKFAVVISLMLVLGFASSLILARMMRPAMHGVSSGGAGGNAPRAMMLFR